MAIQIYFHIICRLQNGTKKYKILPLNSAITLNSIRGDIHKYLGVSLDRISLSIAGREISFERDGYKTLKSLGFRHLTTLYIKENIYVGG